MANKKKNSALALVAGILITPFGPLPTNIMAAQRALIVGAGDYQVLDADLIGIDVDVEMMLEVAMHLGFSEDEIRVLHDEDATYANIEAAMTTWVRDGVTAEDKVFIYFSGHGSRIADNDGDEADGIDEVFLPTDAFIRRNRQPGEPRFGNIVFDDQIAAWLEAIPTTQTVVLIDSCYSGSITRSVAPSDQSSAAEIGQLKYFGFPGAPRSAGAEESVFDGAALNYAGLSASRGDEPAITTISGGYFSQGVWRAINDAIADKHPITMQELHEAATRFVDSRMDDERMFFPTLSGNPELIGRPLPLADVPSGYGPRWQRLAALAADAQPLSVTSSEVTYLLEDSITLEVEIPAAGYLNVFTIDASDQTTVLFPNEFNQDNRVEPGRLSIPTREMDFVLSASEPIGPTLVAAILTEAPVNTFELGLDTRDERGVVQTTFAELSPRAAVSLREAKSQAQDAFHAGVLTINITR